MLELTFLVTSGFVIGQFHLLHAVTTLRLGDVYAATLPSTFVLVEVIWRSAFGAAASSTVTFFAMIAVVSSAAHLFLLAFSMDVLVSFSSLSQPP